MVFFYGWNIATDFITEAEIIFFSGAALSSNMGTRKLYSVLHRTVSVPVPVFLKWRTIFAFFRLRMRISAQNQSPKIRQRKKQKNRKQGPVACCSSRADEPSHMTWREHNRIMAASSFCSPMTLLNIKSILTSDDCPMPTFALYLNWELNKSAIPVKWGAHLSLL